MRSQSNIEFIHTYIYYMIIYKPNLLYLFDILLLNYHLIPTTAKKKDSFFFVCFLFFCYC